MVASEELELLHLSGLVEEKLVSRTENLCLVQVMEEVAGVVAGIELTLRGLPVLEHRHLAIVQGVGLGVALVGDQAPQVQ